MKASNSATVPSVWLLSDNIMGPRGGGFRQQRWCEYFLAQGWSMRLFHVSGAFGLRWEDVHSVEELRTKREVWIKSATPRAGIRDSRWARAARLIKHTFIVDLYLPSVLRLLLTTYRLLLASRAPVILLCSSPPFSMAIVGGALKTMCPNRAIMVLDMRDLWSLHTAFRGPKFHKRWIERVILRRADVLTTVSEGLSRRYESSFSRKALVAYNVATHVPKSSSDSINWSDVSSQIRPNSTKFVYTGSIPENYYKIDDLLSALEQISVCGDTNELDIQFIFVGAVENMAIASRHYELSTGMLVFLPQVSHETSHAIQRCADALLFFGYNSPDNQGQVSIKLFEYFKHGRPILPVHVAEDSDIEHLISLYCGYCPHYLTPSAISEAIISFCHHGRLPHAKDASPDAELLRAYRLVVTEVIERAASPVYTGRGK